MRSVFFNTVFLCQIIYAANLAAAPCEDNFTSTGNVIVGSTYKTFSELPNVSPENAYQGAYSDIAKEPAWKILSSDKTNGVINVVQSSSYSKGKTIPLNIVIEPTNGGSKISMSYATPAGSLSPESAIKTQFCQTITSASNGVAWSQNTANRSTPHDNNQIDTTNSASTRGRVGVAAITKQQQDKIVSELSKKLPQKALQEKITEASATIKPFLELQSCLNDYRARSSVYIYVESGRSLSAEAPMAYGARYHDKQQCMTIARVSGWKSPALNALQFDVLYLADDSGETIRNHHEIVKQPDGVWLLTN